MRGGGIDNCLSCHYPPSSPHKVRNWSEEATTQTAHSSQHQIKDFARGLLPNLVENNSTRASIVVSEI
ncbi:hypothetical protein SAMD00079811_52860 [Scytonema sp. HK-05]|nr:hypothetical protein SAMD00079811_52860 [Scytonema sp. HK-05]